MWAARLCGRAGSVGADGARCVGGLGAGQLQGAGCCCFHCLYGSLLQLQHKRIVACRLYLCRIALLACPPHHAMAIVSFTQR